MKKLIISLLSLVILSLGSCASFNINEAAHFSHKCPSKHAQRLHVYNGKLYYSSLPENSPLTETKL